MTVLPACLSSLIVFTGASKRSMSYMTTFFVVLIVPQIKDIIKLKSHLIYPHKNLYFISTTNDIDLPLICVCGTKESTN